MNGNSFLLDTNIIIYLLNGDETLAKVLFGKQFFVSIISEIEILGYPELSIKDRRKIISFLEDCTVVEIAPRIKELAIELRAKYRIKVLDAIVLASSVHLNIPVIIADKALQKIAESDIILYQN
jgi:hypothetical protein